MRRIPTATASALCVLFLCSIAPAAEPAKTSAKITYDDHVLPFLRDKCLSCHSPDKQKGGLQMHTYARLMVGGSSGAVVTPGDPENSRLYGLIAHKEKPPMPPDAPMLPAENVELIRKWIAGGALENNGSKAVVARPKVNIGLASAARGKPAGPPPMPPKSLRLDPVVRTARPTTVTALASSPWAPLVAVGGQKQVFLYNSDTLELIGVLPFPEGVPQVLKFSRNGSMLLAGGGRGGHSGHVAVWSVLTGERIITVGDETDSVLAADISPDQTQIALGGPSKMIRVYSTKDGKLAYEIKKHTDWVTALEYSPDGVLLATGDRSSGLYVWEAFTGREYFALRGFKAAITEISWRADGNVVASSSEDGTVNLFEMENGNSVKTWAAHNGGVASVRFARDGRLVTGGRDKLVKVWDGNGAVQKTFEVQPDVVVRTIFSHEDARVIASDWNGHLPVWFVADAKPAGELSSNPGTSAERLEAALKDVVAKQAAKDQFAAAAATSQAAAQKTQTDLAAAQKAVIDTAAAAKTADDNVVKAKAAADQTKAAVVAAQADVRAKETLRQALTEAAAKVKAVADQAKTDTALAAALAKAQQIVATADGEVVAAQKVVADQTAAAQKADTALVQAQQTATATAAAAAAAPQVVPPLDAAAKAASAKATTDKTAADNATAALLTSVAAYVEKVKAAQAGK